MPEVLDRCVAQLRARGVSESSAFAICTASLQRSGRLRRRTSEALLARYRAWADRSGVPDVLDPGLSAGFPTLAPDDIALVERIREVGLTDREGVLGLARLHSLRIELNPNSFSLVGGSPIWYAGVLVHEAVHAVLGFGEQEATRVEQRYAGKRFGEALLERDRETMKEALLLASMAQGQRFLQVRKRDRTDDFTFLAQTGFTRRAARQVLRVGAIFHQRMLAQQSVREAAASFSAQQFALDLTGEAMDIVQKTVTNEFRRILVSQYAEDEDIVAKALGTDAHANEMRGTAEDRKVFEWAVRESISRGFGLKDRQPAGIVPALRRVGMRAGALPQAEAARRSAAIQVLLDEAAETGLWDSSGALTDVHVKLLMHGYSPILARVKKEVIDAQEEIGPGEVA